MERDLGLHECCNFTQQIMLKGMLAYGLNQMTKK